MSDAQLEQLIRGVDRIADAFDRIASALEKGNELEQSQPERVIGQMNEMVTKLQQALNGSSGFPVTPYRSDAIVELELGGLAPGGGMAPLPVAQRFPPAPGDDEPHA